MEEVYGWINNEVGVNHISRQKFFGVPKKENTDDIKFLLVLNLWDCKLRYSKPTTQLLKGYIIGNLKSFSNLSRKFCNSIIRSSFYGVLVAHLG